MPVRRTVPALPESACWAAMRNCGRLTWIQQLKPEAPWFPDYPRWSHQGMCRESIYLAQSQVLFCKQEKKLKTFYAKFNWHSNNQLKSDLSWGWGSRTQVAVGRNGQCAPAVRGLECDSASAPICTIQCSKPWSTTPYPRPLPSAKMRPRRRSAFVKRKEVRFEIIIIWKLH